MPDAIVNILAAVVFGIALLHTFSTKLFERLAHRCRAMPGCSTCSARSRCVFGFWAFVLVAPMAVVGGSAAALAYAESRHYTEPLFVFVVMVVAASRPVLQAVRALVATLARAAPLATPAGHAWLGLALVPLLGSLDHRAGGDDPRRADAGAASSSGRSVPKLPKYVALGVLFVNVSIGGTLTSYAAPPVLMVAATWGWTAPSCSPTSAGRRPSRCSSTPPSPRWCCAATCDDARRRAAAGGDAGRPAVPPFIVALHLAVPRRGGRCSPTIRCLHRPVPAVPGLCAGLRALPGPAIIREALLVGFFLAGLVVLGGLQQWWLQPLVSAFAARAVLRRARPDRHHRQRRADLPRLADRRAVRARRATLVAGAVAGGGLTVIANAPNPAGVALLKPGFSDEAIGAGGLLLGALPGTLVAMAAFMFL